MGCSRRHEAAAGHLGAACLARRWQYRAARSAGACRRRGCVGRNAPGHRTGGDAAAGAGAAADVAGIPEEMMMDCRQNRTSFVTARRALLLGGASFASWALLAECARAPDGRGPRLFVVILRGALDGLATVAPLADPDYATLHGSIALTPNGPHAATMLDSFFALHPAMPEFVRMYRQQHAAVIHAVATPYRDRSHFDGQDVLESGFAGPGRVQSGWLDRALAEFEIGLGERWRDTVVVVATEFGRTARINGTEGTDHGTGTVALLAGGAVKGGRVISDWPGLKPASLHEGRDLAPTTDLRAVLKGVLRDHLGIAERVLAETVFPESASVKPIKGLVG